MTNNKLLFISITALSTCFVFFQSAGIISISIILAFQFTTIVLFLLLSRKLVLSRSHLYLFSTIAVMIVSWFYSVDRELTGKYLLVMLVGAGLYSIVYETNKSILLVSRIIVLFSIVNTVITVFSVVFKSSFDLFIGQILPRLNTRFEYASGILGQTGSNSYVICYLIIYSWVVFLSNQKKKKASLFFLLLSIIALVLTGKRGPLIWVALSCFVVYCISTYHNPKIMLLSFGKMVIVLLVLLILQMIFRDSVFFSKYVSRFDNMQDSSRLELYSLAFQRIRYYFPFGMGAGAYNHFGAGAHNDYLQLLAESGLISFCLFLAFIIRNLYFTTKNYLRLYDNNVLFSFGLQVFMILNALTATSFLHFGFFFLYMEVSASGSSLISCERE